MKFDDRYEMAWRWMVIMVLPIVILLSALDCAGAHGWIK